MPATFHVDSQRRRVFMTLEGAITIDDMVTTVRALAQHPDFGPGVTVFSDHTRISVPATPEMLRTLVAEVGSLGPRFAGVRWAICAGGPASFGMMRMLETLAELHLQMEVRAFNSTTEAEQWLDRARPGAPR